MPIRVQADEAEARMARLRAGAISLGVGTAIFLGKLFAWRLTGSTAVLSDALESVINVVAAALLLYSLLPIVRNVHAGLLGIPDPLRESAEALGLPPLARLLRIELPLASPSILAGVKTSAVINVGTATLGALIGAGGYGQPILAGIRLDSVPLLLEGAIPAAVLALAVQGLFDGLERILVPRGLRLGRGL